MTQVSKAMEGDALVQSLVTLANETGMPIVEENGQRRFGPPINFAGIRPPISAEVYVGHLPSDCYEPELIPVLANAGRIFEMRLILDFNRSTRGYCFVQYFADSEAEKAVLELNNYEIREGWFLTVVHSTSKRSLHLRNLPPTKTPRDITYLMSRLAKGVVTVTVPRPRDHQRGNKNRGYCFVEFDSHVSAVNFLSKWSKQQIKVYTDNVTIEWADMIPQQPNAIIVNDLAPHTTNEKIISIFNEVSDNGVDRIEKRADGVYVFFRTHDQAQSAKNALHYKNIDGAIIKIKIDTVTTRNQMSVTYHPSNDEHEYRRTVSSCENDDNFVNEHLSPTLNSYTNIQPIQNFPVTNYSNTAIPYSFLPNQSQSMLSVNNLPSVFPPNTPQLPSQGIFLYGPYYPPPVYMLPVQFASQQPR